MKNCQKYDRYDHFVLNDRTWPTKTVTHAPIWGSVDLRDGNQALPVPMTIEKKKIMFQHLVDIGFKHIEVGFPFASDTDYNFVRTLIEEDLVPDDVDLLVLSSSTKACIDKSFEAVKGAKNAAVQIYSLCSPAQRKYVIHMSKKELVKYTRDAALYVKEMTEKYSDTKFILGYGPESFTITEMDFALEVCNSVVDAWQPTLDNKCMITLPSTVEVAMPNEFADQVEYINRNLVMRENVVFGIHPHNDRGTGIATAELGLLAGADRIEGTLFGNGERTGNVDLVTLALNMYTTGIDPVIDLSNIEETKRIYEECTGLTIPIRQPYAGKLVFTAYSGGHQDAIRKGLLHREETKEEKWLVPYIPIDPTDIGRNLDSVIQINAQSGKGGINYILEKSLNITLPKSIQLEMGKYVKSVSDKSAQLLSSEEVLDLFQDKYDLRKNIQGSLCVELTQKDNVVDTTIYLQDHTLKETGTEQNIFENCYEMLKEYYQLDNIQITEFSNSVDNKGQFYNYIQLKSKDDALHEVYGWELDKNKSQITALVIAIEKVLSSQQVSDSVAATYGV